MIKYYKKPVLKEPYLIATWPGMGLVATGVGMYLLKKLKFEKFAEIPAEAFFSLSEVVVKDGVASLPKSPQSIFYYCKNPDIILFFGESQPVQHREYELAQWVVEVAMEWNIKLAFTAAAAPINIHHKDKPGVWGVANSAKLLSYLKKFDVELMTDGHIGGLNGLLLGVLKEQNIPGICLLGEIPLYMIEMENPKASKEILKILVNMIGIEIDFTELDEKVRETEEKIDAITREMAKKTEEIFSGKLPDIFKELFPGQKEKDASKLFREIKFGLPQSAKEKIEQLFKEAEMDLSKANELKKELDKWGVYKDYEDRFLDLFKKQKPEDKSQ